MRLRAVVTFVAQSRAFLFVQDATDGIFVDAADVPADGVRAGDAALVEGITAAGLFAPEVRLRRLTPAGAAVLPPARPVTYPELASGKLDSQLVSIEGTVRAVDREPPRADGQFRLAFELQAAGAVFHVRVALGDPRRAAELEGGRLIDATVRLRGVCGGVFNGQRQLIGVVLHAADVDGVTVLEPAATADPFGQPPQAIPDLFRFSPGAGVTGAASGPGRARVARALRRVRVDGTVAYFRSGEALYLSDGQVGLFVQTTRRAPLAPGDRVQVVGFPAMGDWTPLLEDADYLRVGGGAGPAPVATTAAAEASERAHDGRLVRLEADLLESADRGPGGRTLVLRDGAVLFEADLPGLPAASRALEPGSRLELTGISVARVDRLLQRPTAFRLLLRGPDDVVVRARPSWWNLRRLGMLLAGLAATFVLVLGWVWILRRRVHDQTEIIRGQLQHEAALEERYRDLFENANDLVFSLAPDGHLLAVNRAAEELTGFRRAELLAGSIYERMPPDQREPARKLVAALLAGKEAPLPFETALVARDGRVVPLEMTARPTVRGGRRVGVEGIARDVSPRRRAEQEISAANQRLLDVSRRAGMAEVASSVLHNVGNVLNSVNVSAALLADRLRASRTENLVRAVGMLRERDQEGAGRLASFLGEDPQGRQLVEYLTGVGDHLLGEQRALLAEVEQLTHSVDHIKEIVVMQQGYARAKGGVEETLAASALVSEAVRFHADGLARSGVALRREVVADPEITVEKHKVLQILVNLIGNARDACGSAGAAGAGGGASAPGQITVTVEAPSRKRVRFVVSDSGVGIAPENLTRIFHHGFTTRKDGHGFGLHSAALTARELGGSLTAASDGPGRGATFMLEVPTAPAYGEKRTTRERLKIII